jgi:hypothetical protein
MRPGGKPGGRTTPAGNHVCAAASASQQQRAGAGHSHTDSTTPAWRMRREETAIPATDTHHRRGSRIPRHDLVQGNDLGHGHDLVAVSGRADCPRCGWSVPPASDIDRAADVLGPHPPGWRLCWCGYAWTPTAARE